MKAVIESGSSQYTVEKGTKFEVNRLTANEGDTVDFDVLAILGDSPKMGQPKVDGASVKAKVLSHKRDDKIIVGKYKRRKGYHKKQGHRQDISVLEVTEVKA